MLELGTLSAAVRRTHEQKTEGSNEFVMVPVKALSTKTFWMPRTPDEKLIADRKKANTRLLFTPTMIELWFRQSH